MKTSNHRHVAVATHGQAPEGTPWWGMRDVPGLLAGRVGDLYAAEELRARTQRTRRMIQRARASE